MSEPLHVVCADCLSVNRVPVERLEDRPNCGQCKNALFRSTPLELTEANFDKLIARSDLPVVVDFWAPWCGPCKAMAPDFRKAAATLQPHVILAKLDTQAWPAVASPLNISSIPALIFFSKGEEVTRMSGAMGETQILQWVRAIQGQLQT